MRGILLVNIGTPARCEKADVQNFIGEMLSDPLLLGKKEWLSKFLSKKIIAPLSAPKSFKKYQIIWRKEDPKISPLLFHMQRLSQLLEEKKGIPVEIAMRYGEPGISSGLVKLEKKCPLLREVIVFPMFPQYAQSTTQTIVNELSRLFYRRAHSYRLRIVEPYFDHPAYIHALATNIQQQLQEVDKVVFCSHSLPINQVIVGWKKGKEFDYVYQLKETIRLLCEKLHIESQRTLLLYSSQRGKKWLKPFLNTDIGDLPKMNWKKIAVVAPGFAADNLETLYDVNVEARELFMEAGGEKFLFIPSLNHSDEWIEAIWKIAQGV